jgi:DNA-binding NarL/FixJ family response regulator
MLYVRDQDTGHTTPLTPREKQVLIMIAKGRSSKEIAAELGISDRTVQTHTGNLLAKLHVTSRTQAALIAVRQGLVDPES